MNSRFTMDVSAASIKDFTVIQDNKSYDVYKTTPGNQCNFYIFREDGNLKFVHVDELASVCHSSTG